MYTLIFLFSISCSVFGRPSGFFTSSFSIISLANSETYDDNGAGESVVIAINISFKLYGGDFMKGCSKEETSWYRIIPKAHMSTLIQDGSDDSVMKSITSGERYANVSFSLTVSYLFSF
jgi:hypothetical protein